MASTVNFIVTLVILGDFMPTVELMIAGFEPYGYFQSSTDLRGFKSQF